MKARDGSKNVTVLLRGITIITSSFLARPPCRAFFWGWLERSRPATAPSGIDVMMKQERAMFCWAPSNRHTGLEPVSSQPKSLG